MSRNSPLAIPLASAVGRNSGTTAKILLLQGMLTVLKIMLALCIGVLERVGGVSPARREQTMTWLMCKYVHCCNLEFMFAAERELDRLRPMARDIVLGACGGYRRTIDELGLAPWQLARLKEHLRRSPEVVIAEVDQEGGLLSRYGPIPGFPNLSKDDFVPRRRFRIEVVAAGRVAAVRKHYAGQRISFLRELLALHTLGRAGCRVPSLLKVDFDRWTITLSLIFGHVLREQLIRRGAMLRDSDLERDPAYRMASAGARRLRRIEEGAHLVEAVTSPAFIQDLANELAAIHDCDVAVNDIKFGNIIIERDTRTPYIIDFEAADCFRRLPASVSKWLKERDRRLLARFCGSA